MSDTTRTTIKTEQSFEGSVIKGGEIQVLNTSGTTTVTQEMANLVIPTQQTSPSQSPSPSHHSDNSNAKSD